MRLLIDTHFAIWLSQNAGLTLAERQLLERSAGQLLLSVVSLWEVRLKWHSFHVSGDRKGSVAPETVMSAMAGMDIALLPLLPAHAITPLAVPLAHNDPFDELLLAQAQVEGLRLMTRDRQLRDHPLALAV